MLCPRLRREGRRASHTRVERLYREERLSSRRRGRRKQLNHRRAARERPMATNQTWAVDFTHDRLGAVLAPCLSTSDGQAREECYSLALPAPSH
jgi:transposase InsO family protein